MKKYKFYFLFPILMIFLSFSIPKAVRAYEVLDQGTIDFEYEDDCQIDFHTQDAKKVVLAVTVKNEDCEAYEDGDLFVDLLNENGDTIKSWNTSLSVITTPIETWYSYDGLKNGNYSFFIENTQDAEISVSYKVIQYKKTTQNCKLKTKSVTVTSGKEKKLQVLPLENGAYPDVKSVNYSKKYITDVWWSHDGSPMVTGKNPGKSIVKIKCRNGKVLKIKVNVRRATPDVFASIVDYNTRNNYFEVSFRNNGTTNLTVYRRGQVCNENYKSFDRTIKNTGSVTLKPGDNKTLRFYLKGYTTWYDYEEYWMYTKIGYQGRTYNVKVTPYNSFYKQKNRWERSYKDKMWYDYWNED